MKWMAIGVAASIGFGLLLAGLKQQGQASIMGSDPIKIGVAVIYPTKGNKARGVVRFFQRDDGKVKVVAEVEGLQPNGKHGFHIHEYGDCSALDAASAGGHYNPEGYPHAGPDAEKRHAGDLGNLVADEQGRAHYELVVDNITVDGTRNPILGRAVIVHEKPDDLVTQPTGNAGARIGCGVIGVGNPDLHKP